MGTHPVGEGRVVVIRTVCCMVRPEREKERDEFGTYIRRVSKFVDCVSSGMW